MNLTYRIPCTPFHELDTFNQAQLVRDSRVARERPSPKPTKAKKSPTTKKAKPTSRADAKVARMAKLLLSLSPEQRQALAEAAIKDRTNE